MLVKNGLEGISHFMNHSEMLPYVGGEVLYVGECVNLPEGFANKAELFRNWYEEPTPNFLRDFLKKTGEWLEFILMCVK